MSAIEDIAAERRRQIEAEGFDAARDDQYQDGQLADSAAAYAVTEREIYARGRWMPFSELLWPWRLSVGWLKRGDRRRDLVKAGALIVAEIERLDRLEGRA